MDMLEGRVAFVTGGSRGLGAAFAISMAREGADIAVCDAWRDLESVPYQQARQAEMEAVQEEIRKLGRRCHAGRADVTKAEEIEEFVAKATAQLGPIDICIANAGIASFGNVWELTEAQWDQMIDVNLKGVWLTCKSVIPSMIERRYGKLICLSSIFGQKGAGQWAHYCAAKFGVVGLVKTMAIELAPYEINVNALAPTGVDTSMTNYQAFYDLHLQALGRGEKGGTKETTAESWNQVNLFQRGYIDPQDVANAAVFLASDAARQITGHVLPVDAGALTK